MLTAAAAVALVASAAHAPPPAPPCAYCPQPRVHVTPPCYQQGSPTQGGWHDTAGALLHPVTSEWHVFVGPIWQHLSSSDLVNWEIGPGYKGMGGSGTLIYDHARNLTVALTGTVDAFTTDSPRLQHNFTPAGQIFKTADPVHNGSMGCWDPVIFWDERVSKYFAMGACGHNTGGMTGGGGYGLQQYFASPAISGPGADWKELPHPFLEWHTETVPRVGQWPRTHEFVTPDFFPLGQDDAWVFITTTYGGMKQTGLVDPSSDEGNREYDYSNYLVGPRPAPGAAFVPDVTRSAPFDWSPWKPVSDSASKNLTFATSKGMEQFGCCPKTAGNASRRVLFGWINNGWGKCKAALAALLSKS